MWGGDQGAHWAPGHPLLCKYRFGTLTSHRARLYQELVWREILKILPKAIPLPRSHSFKVCLPLHRPHLLGSLPVSSLLYLPFLFYSTATHSSEVKHLTLGFLKDINRMTTKGKASSWPDLFLSSHKDISALRSTCAEQKWRKHSGENKQGLAICTRNGCYFFVFFLIFSHECIYFHNQKGKFLNSQPNSIQDNCLLPGTVFLGRL